MPYLPAERGTYQRRGHIDRAEDGMTTYGPPYYDLVIMWEIVREDGGSTHVRAITVSDINNGYSDDNGVWLGEVTTLLPSDASVIR